MFLKFDIDSCKDCYSCLRHCPVKAIDFTNNKAEIIEEQCILCGECVHVCPQNAKKVYSDVDNVKKLIKENDNVFNPSSTTKITSPPLPPSPPFGPPAGTKSSRLKPT